jgi:CHAT domain-containing protein/tetratricopeptide (TPR) repeat protein
MKRTLVVLFFPVFFSCLSGYAQKSVEELLELEEGYTALFRLKGGKIATAGESLLRLEALYYAYGADSVDGDIVVANASDYAAFLALLLRQNDPFSLDELTRLEKLARGKHPFKFRCNTLLAKKLLESGEVERAANVLTVILGPLREDSSKNYIQLAKTYNLLGRVSRRTRNWQTAIALFNQALAIYDRSEYPKQPDAARVLNNLAITYQELNDYRNARLCFSRSLQLKERFDSDSINLAISYNNLGNFYLRFNAYQDAEQAYQRGLQLTDRVRYANRIRPELLSNYSNLLMDKLQAFATAREVLDVSIVGYVKRQGRYSRELFSALRSRARAQIELQEFAAAEQTLAWLDSINLTQPLSSDQQLELFLARASFLNIQQRDVDCYKVLQKCDSIRQGKGIPDWLQKEYWEILAQNRSHGPRKDTAIQIVKHLLRNYPSASRLDLVRWNTDLGVYFFWDGEPDSARFYLRGALKLNGWEQTFNRTPYVFPIYALQAHYIELLMLQKQAVINSDQALYHIESGEAIILATREGIQSARDRVNYARATSSFFDAGIQICYRLFQETGEQVFFGRCFSLMQQAKYQTLYLAIAANRLEAFSRVPLQVADRERQLTAARNRFVQQATDGWLQQDTTGALREFADQLQRSQHSYEQFVDSLRKNLPDYFHLKYSLPTVSIDKLTRELIVPKQTNLLEYHVMDSTVLMVLVTPAGQWMWHLPVRNLQQQVGALRRQIGTPLGDAQNPAYQLYQQLFQPADRVLANIKGSSRNRLMVIPDKELIYLPFEVLKRTATTSTDYLVGAYTFTYALSSSLSWQSYTDELLTPVTKGFLGVAPSFSGEAEEVNDQRRYRFSPLANTENELKGIGAFLGKRQIKVDVLQGARATKRAFVQRSGNYSLIHIASHGFVNMADPLRSGIAFTDEPGQPDSEVLFGFELFNLSLRARLVTLSACETGLGKIYRGEGLVGLSRGFFYAGAQNLVLSLWKVADQATAEFMVDFYKGIGQEFEFDIALRKAKLKMLKDERHSHPYYWAPFILVGS